jgi:outer membrane protein assembly factor BamD (BamD/ComL family)
MVPIADITGRGLVLRSSSTLFTSTNTYTGKRQRGIGGYLPLFLVFIMIPAMLICGCSYIDGGLQARSISQEANDFFNQGDYEASLSKYEQIIEKHPAVADRVLFEMGIIYAYPRNEQKDYQKSLGCFQKLVRDYPDSEYRRDSQMMIFQIHNVIIKDKIIATQQTQIETSWQEAKSKKNEIITLQEHIEMLEQDIAMREQKIQMREQDIEMLEQEIFALRTEPADKVLIEKKQRRLTLLSKGEVIKTYKIALGGNPVGPKERQDDNKTPEGTYIIDARNSNSGYHLSLHISYPNEKDTMRAKELGVSPGGDIMIHGIKNGLSWVGASHAGVDWTKGCIAVTDEEMEEIYKLVPNGTIVEIRP